MYIDRVGAHLVEVGGYQCRGFCMVETDASCQPPLRQEAQLRDGEFIELQQVDSQSIESFLMDFMNFMNFMDLMDFMAAARLARGKGWDGAAPSIGDEAAASQRQRTSRGTRRILQAKHDRAAGSWSAWRASPCCRLVLVYR